METSITLQYTAFNGQKILAAGNLEDVALKVSRHLKSHPDSSILVFSDATGKVMDLDLRGSDAEISARLKVYLSPEQTSAPTTGPGRPKLGVVAREVSLLPRHWEWLATQPGGASGTLRRLVEDAKKGTSGREQLRQAQERAHKFLSALAGDLPNYEDSLRALYAKDKKKFQSLVRDWPADIRDHAKDLSEGAWG